MRAIVRFLAIVLPSFAIVGSAVAADFPIKGGIMRLQEREPARRRFFFRSAKQVNISLATIGDPSVSGATLEVFGSGAGDGNTGVINLPPEFWRPLGNPAGNSGYLLIDRDGTNDGVKRVLLKPRAGVGGVLLIVASGIDWPYALGQPQGDITLRFTVGGNVFCAFLPYQETNNLPKKILRKNAPPPPSCN